MLDRYLKICTLLMHHYTPTVIINSVTRDGSFQLGWNLKRAPKGRAVISGLSVPRGKHIKDPITTSLSPLGDKDYWAFHLLVQEGVQLMWPNELLPHTRAHFVCLWCAVQVGNLGERKKNSCVHPRFFLGSLSKKNMKIHLLRTAALTSEY